MWEGGDLKSLQAGYLATVAVSHYVVLAQGEEGQVSGGRLSEGDVAAVAAAAVATAAVAAADVASGKGHVREMRELENGGFRLFFSRIKSIAHFLLAPLRVVWRQHEKRGCCIACKVGPKERKIKIKGRIWQKVEQPLASPHQVHGSCKVLQEQIGVIVEPANGVLYRQKTGLSNSC